MQSGLGAAVAGTAVRMEKEKFNVYTKVCTLHHPRITHPMNRIKLFKLLKVVPFSMLLGQLLLFVTLQFVGRRTPSRRWLHFPQPRGRVPLVERNVLVTGLTQASVPITDG